MHVVAGAHDLVAVRPVGGDTRRDRLHDDVVVAPEEEGDRVAVRLERREDTVARRDEDVVCGRQH